ncbi:MAG: DUF2147 domain-containing protein [Bacteroidia bacterium]|nr:DUF2147 domain-containing protein [Bacteroidia bacterium]
MKKIFLLIPILALLSFTSFSNKGSIKEDDVVATWLNADKDAHIRIFKAVNGKYAGKVEWLKQPNDPNGKPKKDTENPNIKLRERERLGLVIMQNFAYNTKSKQWQNGTIYDPKTGKTYDGYMYFEGENINTLHLRGFVMGMSWLGKTNEWTRINP